MLSKARIISFSMKALMAAFLFLTSALLFVVGGQPLPPGVVAFPGMEGPYCFTGETSAADNKEDAKNGFILAEILFIENGFKISVPVERTYPLYPPCKNNPAKI
jgi:hypothetical protein